MNQLEDSLLAALVGTALITSLKTSGFVVGNPGGQKRPCRIGLRVDVPGRESYDVTIRQNFEPWVLGMVVQPGRTVPIAAEEANPQHIRIDLSQPLPRANPQNVRVNVNQPPTAASFADVFRQSPGSVPVVSAADLLASGQRVPGVLKSFAAMGTTRRSLGRTPSRPELLDAPHFMFEVELQFPNLAPVTGRAVQLVPPSQVPNLAIGLTLACVVDPADPAHRFVADWPPG